MTKQTSPSLPEPQAPIDPLHRPFVGNMSVDENLREILAIAIWNLLGARGHTIAISVTDGIVRLEGMVNDSAEETALLKLARSHTGIRDVINGLEIAGSEGTTQAGEALIGAPPRKLAHLVRYCGLDEASIAAALRQGLSHFAPMLVRAGGPVPLVIVYRNLMPGAVTLDIGVPLDVAGEVAPDGEVQIRELPAGEAGAPPPYGMGLGGVLAHVKALLEKGHGYAWQEVRLPDRAEEAALDDIALDAAPLMVPPKAH